LLSFELLHVLPSKPRGGAESEGGCVATLHLII